MALDQLYLKYFLIYDVELVDALLVDPEFSLLKKRISISSINTNSDVPWLHFRCYAPAGTPVLQLMGTMEIIAILHLEITE